MLLFGLAQPKNKNSSAGAAGGGGGTVQGCNEHVTFYAILSNFGDRMTTQHLD